MVYFVFTYFCGAVYNENAYGKYKFSLACTMLLEDMAQAVWVQRGKHEEKAQNLDRAERVKRIRMQQTQRKWSFGLRILCTVSVGRSSTLRKI